MMNNQDWNSQMEGAEDQFRETIRSLMKSHGLTQLDLSAKLGVRQSQVSNWLSGKSMPGYRSLLALRSCFGVAMDKFFLIGPETK